MQPRCSRSSAVSHRKENETPAETHLCPVCRYPGLTKEAYDKHGFGSHETCPSCGFQFDVTDRREGWSFRDWRIKWIAAGMPWSSSAVARPKNWSAQNQLGELALRRPASMLPHSLILRVSVRDCVGQNQS